MNSQADRTPAHPADATVLADQRQRRRYRHFVSEDFLVRLKCDGLLLAGRLGDISEHGLSVLIPRTDPIRLPEQTMVFNGELFGRPLTTPLDFRAGFVWQSQSELNDRPCRVVGLRFTKTVELPDALIAHELSV